MISHITGNVIETRPDSVVVSLGGLGVQVMCSPSTVAMAKEGEPIALFTSLIVREDSLTLYGFDSSLSRELFDIVQSVSGFGPKLAFTVLSYLSAERLCDALVDEDVTVLKSAPGVGAKGAQRLVLELKDKVGHISTAIPGNQVSKQWQDQVIAGLVGLGFTQRDASYALNEVMSEGSIPDHDVALTLRRALQILGHSQ